MILKFTRKIIKNEYKRLLLPFLSMLLTSVVVVVSILLVDSAKLFLEGKSKEILGGDVSLQSRRDFQFENILGTEKVRVKSEQISFSGTLANAFSTTTNVSFKFVDKNFPIYGKVLVENSEFKYPEANEIYIDKNISKSLEVKAGDKLFFNQKDFLVKGILLSEPESLVGQFSFLGKVILSEDAIKYSGVDLQFFRFEKTVKLGLYKNLSKQEFEDLRQKAREMGVRISNSEGESTFEFGLSVVERFLVIAILIIFVLSLVNVYASVNYLENRLRKSFAVLVAIGLDISSIYRILLSINFLILSLASLFGIFIGYFICREVLELGNMYSDLSINIDFNIAKVVATFCFLTIASLFATLPILNRIRSLKPKELLSRNSEKQNKQTGFKILKDILLGIFPLTLISIYFLESFYLGLLVVFLIVLTYLALMGCYFLFVNFLYKIRFSFPFSLRLITAQKKYDGFFGLIAFSSLFIALTSIYSLSVVRTSIEEYLKKDLSISLPSKYILDVQESQLSSFKENFSDITFFPNVRGRILEIDGVNIEEELQKKTGAVDRELGREFNLSFRETLMSGEKVSEGSFESSTGFVSVEKEFTKRAKISLGSRVKVGIQGFEVDAVVNSIREVNTRSGLPFFYFIYSTEDLSKYPKTYFGYQSNQENTNELTNFVNRNFPNVTIIDTGSIKRTAEDLVNALLFLILIITLPPLTLSTLLIITIIESVSLERKRDGARLMGLGKSKTFVRNFFVIESVSLIVITSSMAYIFALVLSNFTTIYYLKIKNIIYFDFYSFIVFIIIVTMIVGISFFMWRKTGKSLKEYLSYEENN